MKTFGLENVKAFSDTGDIEIAPLTIFVGQNSCGKSSLIRFPVLLYQAVQDNAFPIRMHSERINLVDYGDFDDVIHNHSGNTFSFKFSYTLDQLSCKDRLCVGVSIFAKCGRRTIKGLYRLGS